MTRKETEPTQRLDYPIFHTQPEAGPNWMAFSRRSENGKPSKGHLSLSKKKTELKHRHWALLPLPGCRGEGRENYGLLIKHTAIFAASTQNGLLWPNCENVLLTCSKMVIFILSTTPFRCGVLVTQVIGATSKNLWTPCLARESVIPFVDGRTWENYIT